jgi:rhodanese-related sulfurtransferase
MAEANAVIETVSVHDAIAFHGQPGFLFVDLRRDAERSEHGQIPGAINAPRGHLEFYVDPMSAMHNPAFASGRRLILFCASGGRSTLAAKTLYDMGVPNVAHIAGGFAAWKEAGGPVEAPKA